LEHTKNGGDGGGERGVFNRDLAGRPFIIVASGVEHLWSKMRFLAQLEAYIADDWLKKCRPCQSYGRVAAGLANLPGANLCFPAAEANDFLSALSPVIAALL